MTVVDDLDGRELDPQDAQTVSWSWLGVDYEIDVSTANLEKIEQGKVTVAKLIKASTRVGGRRRSASRSKAGASGSTDANVNAAIREWAADNGYEVSARGRIPNDIVEAYNSAH
ncbi:Lsr2 family protein [Gordonia jinghuaiqii]|nr:Lsr2 family protein [Gordonia jinghuaiqii]